MTTEQIKRKILSDSKNYQNFSNCTNEERKMYELAYARLLGIDPKVLDG